MAEKGIFKNIKESLDEIMSGRRYLISAIDKLKRQMPDLAPQVEKLTSGIESISNLATVSQELGGNLNQLKDALGAITNLSSTMNSMRSEMQNMSSNIQALRPILDSIRDYSQRQENGLRGISEALQALMGQMGQILAKLE